MRARFAILAALLGATFAGTASAAEGSSTIARSAVESGETVETVRLMVAPAVENVQSKIVCSPDSIRVRFQGIKLEDNEIEDLETPNDGPMRKVRVVPRGGKNSVVQIFARGRQMDACYRTTVMVVDDEVVISMALNDREKSRRNRILNAQAARQAARQAVRESAEGSADASANVDEKVKNDAPAKSATERGPANELARILESAKRGDVKDAPAEETENEEAAEKKIDAGKLGLADVTGGDDDSDGLRYLAGIGFALLVAGIAWYIKRRKGGVRGEMDSIDILSQKRLSAHQSLIVAQVHGHKFLLAIGDKTVTNLGMLPEEPVVTGATVPMHREPVYPAAPRQQIPPMPRPEPVMASAPMPAPMPRTQQAGPVRQTTRSFEDMISEELYGRTEPGIPAPPRAAPQQQPVSTETRAYGDATPSNVAGLISMARMRASLNQTARQAPTAEA